MPDKQYPMNTVIRRTVLFLSVLLPILACLFFASPLIIDSYILPRLLTTAGSLEKHGSLTRLTPFSVQGFLRIEDNSAPVLSVPYIKAHFSPGGLVKRRFSSVRMDHATFHLHKIDGKYRLKGVPGPEAGKSSRPGELSPFLLPLATDRLILKECSLLLYQEGMPQKRVSLSADLALNFSTASKHYRLESLSGTLSFSDIITAFGSITASFENSRIDAELEMEAERLPVSALELPESLLAQSGKLKTVIRCSLNPETMSIERLEAGGHISSLRVAKTDIPHADLRIEKDIDFSVFGTPESLEYKIGPVTVESPVSAEFKASGTGSLTRSGLSTKGELALRLFSERPLITPPPLIATSYQASFSEGHGLQVDLTAGSDRETKISTDTLDAVISPFQITAAFSAAETISSNIAVNAVHAGITVNNQELLLDGGSFSSALTRDKDGTRLELKAAFSQISLPSRELMLKNVNLEIPVVYPFTAKPAETAGTFAIAGIYLKNSPFAELSGSISQIHDSWKLTGSVASEYLAGSGIDFSASTAPMQRTGALDWNLGQTAVSSNLLPPFVKVPENLGFQGQLSARGALLFKRSGLSGNVAVFLEEGVIEIDGDKGRIEGVNCNVELERLPEIVSSPSQSCRAESIHFGNLHFSDLEARFRIDGPDTIFIEKSRAGWCRGTIESTSLSLSLADRKIDTVVYCSRINFAELLNQFGLDQADGEGSVNGKLPVHFSSAGVRFDDGFLFSTPGTGGIVKFSNTEMLRQGVGSVDAGGYLEYSMAAMEDFSYNWTKLSFNSAGEELLLTMQLDGKPRAPLPYKLKEGKIIKIPEGEGLQYPIRLDVNFRLPLDDLFRVGQNINTIRENM